MDDTWHNAARTFRSITAPNVSKKRQSFLKVARPRLANALQALEYLAICADKNRYEFGDEDAKYIEEQLRPVVDRAITGFKAGSRKPVLKFPGEE